MSLYDKNNVKKIRNKYVKNINKKYDIIGSNFQRCHIFGIREAKYLELVLKLNNIDTLEKILIWEENTVLLNSYDHRLLEQNKLYNLNLTIQQKILFDCSNLIKSTKFRKSDIELSLLVYNQLQKMII